MRRVCFIISVFLVLFYPEYSYASKTKAFGGTAYSSKEAQLLPFGSAGEQQIFDNFIEEIEPDEIIETLKQNITSERESINTNTFHSDAFFTQGFKRIWASGNVLDQHRDTFIALCNLRI